MSSVGYVYVLHFDRPLAHAQHYVGCTTDPRGRAITHAQGRGARIVRAALAAGIGFEVAALGTTHVRGMRRIERQTKDWHRAAEFCPLCGPNPRAIPGTRPYPMELWPWPRHSDGLAALGPVPDVTVRLTGPAEPIGLSEEVRQLMRTEKDSLGFIPAGGDGGLTQSIIAGRVAVAQADGMLLGYAAWTHRELLRIAQVVVADAHRGSGIGRRLVAEARRAHPSLRAVAKVRDDLTANDFWRGIGFELTDSETHETSGSRLHVWTRHAYAEDGA